MSRESAFDSEIEAYLAKHGADVFATVFGTCVTDRLSGGVGFESDFGCLGQGKLGGLDELDHHLVEGVQAVVEKDHLPGIDDEEGRMLLQGISRSDGHIRIIALI